MDDKSANLSRKLLFREIQTQIREYIAQSNLKPGDMLPPAADIAAKLGVSAGSLREALRALEAIGVLETRHGIGTFVRAYDFAPILENLSYSLLFERDNLRDLVQVRAALEVGLLPEAIRALDQTDLNRLDAIVARMAETNDCIEEDRQFHLALYQHLQNRVVNQLLDVFWIVYHDLSNRLVISNPRLLDRYHMHAPILQAVREGDSDKAIAAMRAHFSEIATRLSQDPSSPQTLTS